MIVVSIVREELSHGELDALEFTVFVVELWIDDVFCKDVRHLRGHVPCSHSSRGLGHSGHKFWERE